MIFKFPPVHEQRLPNGMTVIWVPHHERPAIDVSLQVPFGRFADPVGLEGLAELSVGLMLKGPTGTRAEEFSRSMEQRGIGLSCEVGDEHTIVGFRSLARHAEFAVPLFWRMLCTPSLDTREYSRLQHEMVTSLKADTVEPGSMAHRHFHAELFGPQHPSGRFHTVASVKRIRDADVRSFHARHFVAQGAVLVVCGDFELERGRAEWEPLFASWIGTSAKGPGAGLVAVTQGAEVVAVNRIRLVDRPDLSQTTVVVGHGAPGELAAQRNAVAVANYILGGGNFSSRLVAKVRSAIGRTYGISSQVSGNSHFGTFSISTTTQNAQLGEVLDAIIAVRKEFCEQGVTADELTRAKQFALGNMAFQLEGIVNIAEKLLWLRFFGRDNSYIEQFGHTLGSITLEQVNQAIRTHLASPGIVVAAVGKSAEVRGTLERLGPVRRMHFRKDA